MAKRTTEIPNTPLQRQMQLVQATPSSRGGGIALYAFYVVDLKTGRIVRRFGFDIPPSSLRLSEDAAAEASATQEAGYYAEERGQYFKMLNIQGSFGFRPTPLNRPFQGARNAFTNLQQAVSQIGSGQSQVANIGVQNFPDGERTGFDRLRDLTNLFRFYWDTKMERSTRARYVFVWANWKFGEIYFAQPLGFERDRTAPSGRTKATYTARLRLLAPVQVRKPPDFLSVSTNAKGLQAFLNRIQGVSKLLKGVSQLLTSSVNAALNFGFDVARSIIQPIEETIGAIESAIKGVTSALSTGYNIAQLPINTLRSVHRLCLEAAVTCRTAQGFANLGTDYIRAGRLIQDAWVGLVEVVQGQNVNSVAQAIGKKYKQWDEQAAFDRTKAPDGDPVPGGFGGTDTSLGVKKIPEGAQRITLPGGVSIKGLAAQFLGNAGRWKEIVILNRLQPPYISAMGDGVTVLRPGDMIKMPDVPEVSDDENQIFRHVGEGVDPDLWRYGRDIRVDLETRDLVVNDRGDLDTVWGLENLKQAMYLKIWRVPGDLKVHPWYGFGAEGGDGLAVDTLAGYHLQLRTTLLSDSRVDQINSMVLNAVGDVLHINVALTPKDHDDAIILDTRAALQ